MHITVASLTTSSDIDIRHETQLVKAALLHADRVTLASPKAQMMAGIASFGTLNRRGRMDLTAGFVGKFNEDAARQYQELRSQRDLSSPERRLLRLIEKHLEMGSEQVSASVEEILEIAGAGELARAMGAGLVDIANLSTEEVDLSPAAAEAIIGEMTELLRSSVSATDRTFPLFDDGAGNLLRAMISEGKLIDAHRLRAAEAGIAGRLIAGLEAFPDAEMSVILDVRERLGDPLVRFRSALARASAEFASAAWDESFAREVEDLYRREVAPALLEIKEGLIELGVRPTLLRLASGKEAIVASAAAGAAMLGLAAATGVTHADLPQLLYGPGGIAAVVAAATEARQRGATRGQSVHNAFYFLYQAGRDLAD